MWHTKRWKNKRSVSLVLLDKSINGVRLKTAVVLEQLRFLEGGRDLE